MGLFSHVLSMSFIYLCHSSALEFIIERYISIVYYYYYIKPIQSLINKCIDTCTFPNALKLADVVPIFKKNDMLSKMNYRPISILSCISKIFEKLLIPQLRMYFDDIFSQYLSGYRTSYGCQDVCYILSI